MGKERLLEQGVEIFAKHLEETVIEVFDGKIKDYNISNISTYKLKAQIGDKFATMTTDNLDNDDKIMELLKQSAEIIESNKPSTFATDSITGDREEIVGDDKEKITEFLLSLENLKNEYSQLFALDIFYQEVITRLSIENDKVKSVDSHISHELSGEIVLKVNGINYSEYFLIKDKTFDIMEMKEKLIEEIKRAISKTNPSSCKTGRYSIILTNYSLYKIFKRFIDMFDAKKIDNKFSPLNTYFEKDVFSQKLTIVEDPTNNNLIGKRLFDDEGTKTAYKKVIDSGKFITKLYDNQTAKKDNTGSTGNSYGVRNMYIEPGIYSFQQLVDKMDNGLIIDRVEGMHAGINSKVGSISLQASGFYIENGQKRPINQIILSTNLFELLNNIIEIGTDLTFFGTEFGCPSILVKDIMIVGED